MTRHGFRESEKVCFTSVNLETWEEDANNSSIDCRRPFSGNLSLWSWNARGLFGVDGCRARRKQDRVRWALQHFDIVFVQEAHCGDHLEDGFKHEFNLTHKCWVSATANNHNAGGILIFCKLSFLKAFPSTREICIEPGRIVGVELMGNAGALTLFNIHVEPILQHSRRIEILSQVRKACNQTSMCRYILAGDFNFVLEAEDRFRPALKRFTGQRQADGDYFLEHFSDFLEAEQTDYTRQGGEGDQLVLSRIDRIYLSISSWEAKDFNIYASVDRDLGGRHEKLSDHFPLSVRVFKKSFDYETFGFAPIPSWVAKHPCRPRRLEHHLRAIESMFPDIPHATLGIEAAPPVCNIFGAMNKISASVTLTS
jgi:endonuclease/exonuclease/phosphatase family metal-dependent hydrolase